MVGVVAREITSPAVVVARARVDAGSTALRRSISTFTTALDATPIGPQIAGEVAAATVVIVAEKARLAEVVRGPVAIPKSDFAARAELVQARLSIRTSQIITATRNTFSVIADLSFGTGFISEATRDAQV